MQGNSREQKDLEVQISEGIVGSQTEQEATSVIEKYWQENRLKDVIIGKVPLLIFVIQKGWYKLASFLLNIIGINPNVKYRDNQTVLHYLLQIDYEEVKDLLEDLIEAGVNLNEEASYIKRVPLEIAIDAGNFKAIELLLENGAKPTTDDKLFELTQQIVYKYVYAKSKDILPILINKNNIINRQDFSGYTLMHIAAENGDTGTLSFLLEEGAETQI